MTVDRGVATLPPHVAARLRAQPFSYPDPGVTRDGTHVGALALDRSVELGSGQQVWDSAVTALLTWRVQSRAGLRVAASSTHVAADEVVTLGFGPAFVRLTAPCRVVYVIDEPARQAFAYGTLPGHPEAGEEAFNVTRSEDDRVHFSVVASSRPATALARWGGPVTRRVQHLIVTRYLTALRGQPADNTD